MQKYVNLVDLVKSFIHDYFFAKIGVDTAESEPLNVADLAAGENTELVINRLLKADLASIPGEIAASKPASLKLSGTEI